MALALRWSSPVKAIASQLLAQRPITFAVQHRRLMRWQQIDFVLTPLQELVRMNDDFAPLSAIPQDHWLVWQSVTNAAVISGLPCDAVALCDRLGLAGIEPNNVAARLGMTQLIEAAWRQGGV
jgi:hypothetical protein